MSNYVEHHLMCLVPIPKTSFVKYCSNFLTSFYFVFCFLLLIFDVFITCPAYKSFTEIWFVNMFSQYVPCLFMVLIVCFWWEVLNFCEAQFIIFLLKLHSSNYPTMLSFYKVVFAILDSLHIPINLRIRHQFHFFKVCLYFYFHYIESIDH